MAIPVPSNLKISFVTLNRMGWLSSYLQVGSAALSLALSFGCTSANLRVPEARNAGRSSDEQALPFQQQGNQSAPSLVPPSEELPAGTALTVHLEGVVSSQTAHAGDQFHAILARAITLDSQIVLPSGTRINGKILAAKRSGKRPGYLRLTLQELVLPTAKRPVATTSVFAKGDNLDFRVPNAGDNATPATLVRDGTGGVEQSLLQTATGNADASLDAENPTASDVTINPDRHLTFRLTQALALRD